MPEQVLNGDGLSSGGGDRLSPREKREGTIRICVMRDGPCPHGIDCPFVGDGPYGYPCKEGWQERPRAYLAAQSEQPATDPCDWPECGCCADAACAEALPLMEQPALAAVEPVGVKPLDWRHYPDAFPPMWCAKAPIGSYSIEETAGNDAPSYDVVNPSMQTIANFEGLPEAKAAAQADFDNRIRSALTNPPPDVAVLQARIANLEAADQIISQIEDRFPNWRSYRDLIDCIDCTLAELRQQERQDTMPDVSAKAVFLAHERAK